MSLLVLLTAALHAAGWAVLVGWAWCCGLVLRRHGCGPWRACAGAAGMMVPAVLVRWVLGDGFRVEYEAGVMLVAVALAVLAWHRAGVVAPRL